ncbi:Bro-N domain-containing protein [Candidatus Berkelbacteria bacterium]|nr:Bro-N domain-containing protein [Candidatus Berkelbacteria bacterium]
MAETNIALFEGKEVRKTWHKSEWWFSVIDVIEVLTANARPRKYWSDLKRKLQEEGAELSDKIGQFKLRAPDGKLRATDCANTTTMLRVIQSIPSPKAEPFKRWLAQVGYERIQEINDPELAMKRMRALYEAKGRPKDWIDKRVRGIAVREELTKEWHERGVKEGQEYSILTAEIAKATFGMTPSQYKKFKQLKQKHNLRDHMSDLELIFTMLGEAATTEIARNVDAQGFGENRGVAQRGGTVAGDARKKLELESGRKVSSRQNFLPPSKKRKALEE